ncbi:MAG: amino acid ABC transporter substrate-binding protein [Rhodopila sp.]|nr:amino acid ABC transporter substrate-binding protein [Rhodopila sp.]
MKRLACAAALLLALALPAVAQDVAITGTLAKIRATGKITVGVRDSAMPFSYKLPNGAPAGYAVDLCREIVEDISAELDGMPVAVAYRTVTAESRIGPVVSGDVDIECGSTTRTRQRRQLVAFSPVFFVTGTKLLVSRESPIQSYRDLIGKTVVVTSGTTNEAAMHGLVDRLRLHINIVAAPDLPQALAMLRAGKADAFATDHVLLEGLVATPEGRDYHVVGDYLSYEPYALMYRKDDPTFGAVIEHSFERMAAAGRLSELYSRWLTETLPTGERLNIPMSAMFRVLGQPD